MRKVCVVFVILCIVCYSLGTFHFQSVFSLQKAEEANQKCLLELIMIVKDEVASIQKTVLSVKGIVDRYCILDTGSTDNTTALIKEAFGTTPGSVFSEPFVDFATTRNRVMELAGKECQYTLMLSGDEYLRNGQKYPIYSYFHFL